VKDLYIFYFVYNGDEDKYAGILSAIAIAETEEKARKLFNKHQSESLRLQHKKPIKTKVIDIRWGR